MAVLGAIEAGKVAKIADVLLYRRMHWHLH
jgi:hypothetical protein